MNINNLKNYFKLKKLISSFVLKLTFVFLLILFSIFLPSKAFARNIDLADINNFNIRYDGPNGGNLTNGGPLVTDINGDGLLDLFVGAPNQKYAYIIYNSLLVSLSGKGNVINLANASNYNIRYTSGATGLLSNSRSQVADINDDGQNDLIIGAPYKSNNSRTWSGSVYLIYNNLFASIGGVGNNIDITNSSNYTKRFDGSATEDSLGETIQTADIDSDSKLDLIISAPYASKNGRSYSGSTYVIYNSLLTTIVAQNIDLNIATNYNIRFDGASASMSLSSIGLHVNDLNNDGLPDLILSAHRAGFNSRVESGSLYVIYNPLIVRFSTTGNNVDLTTSTNYNLRFDGATANGSFGNEALKVADLNNNGLSDLIVGSYQSDNNSRTNSGSLYIIYDSIISLFPNVGNNIDLATTSNYNLRFDGPATEYWLGTGVQIADMDGDGKNDILAHSTGADNNSRTDSGSLYVIYNSLFSTFLNTGNSIDLATTSNYNVRYDGDLASSQFADVGATNYDLNLDGKPDILVGSPFAARNGGSGNGSLFVIYNFPHSILLDSVEAITNDDPVDITGTVSATNSVTNISMVQYKEDSNTFAGSWNNCTASDGTYNSTNEDFTCAVSGLSDGSHDIYFRSYDENGSYTALANYVSASFTLDTQAPTSNSIEINSGDTYTNTQDTTLALASTGASEMILSEDSDFVGASWEAYSSTKAFTITSTDGIKTVYAKFKDLAGNETTRISDTITLDTTAPIANSIIINSGDSYTNNRNLTLTIGSTDATEMIISENDSFLGATWEAYNTAALLTISPTDGAKTVFIKFRDIINNETIVYSDNIILDTISPTIKITDLGLISNVPDRNLLTYYFTSQTPLIKGTSDGHTVIFKYGAQIYTTATNQDGHYSISISNPELSRGEVTLKYYCEDRAGNRSETKTLILIIGTESFPAEILTRISAGNTTTNQNQTDTNLDNDTPSTNTPILPTIQIYKVEDENGNLLTNTKVTISNQIYVSDSSGQIYIEGDSSSLSDVKVNINGTEIEGTVNGKIIQIKSTDKIKSNGAFNYFLYIFLFGIVISSLTLAFFRFKKNKE